MRQEMGKHSVQEQPKNLSHLRVGCLPEWSAIPRLSRRKHLADLLVIAGFATAMVTCYSYLLEVSVFDGFPPQLWIASTTVFFFAHFCVRLRPADVREMDRVPLKARRPVPPSEPRLCLRPGLAEATAKPATRSSIRSGINRRAYLRRGSLPN
jgi:hypothetical protein